MRRRWIVIAIWLAVTACARDAEARLDVYIDKSTQRMAVVQDGYMRYMWPVSTSRDGYSTPNGVYSPERLERSWFSRAYYDAPMPYAIFFHNGYAIHGSYDLNRLGGPASHGCIRLYPQHAAVLFGMVEQEGPENTTIVVGDGGQPIPGAPRSRGMDDLPGAVAPADGAIAKAAPPPRLRAAPSGDAGRNIGPPGGNGPLVTQGANRLPEPSGRPVGENGEIAARGANQIREPRNAPSAADRSADAPSRRSDPRPDSTGSSPPPLPIPRRDPDNANDASKTARSAGGDPPASNPAATPEATQATAGYKVLPKSYWSGASWRWRWNGEPDER
jgi:hypothetical protein